MSYVSSQAMPSTSTPQTGTPYGSYIMQAAQTAVAANEVIHSQKSGADKGEDLMHLGGLAVTSVFAPWLAPLAAAIRPLVKKLGLDKFDLGTKVFRFLGKHLFGGPKTNVEQERWQKLAQSGYPYVPPGATDPGAKHYVAKGQLIRPDLAPDFVGTDPTTGQWVNNRFSQTRSEADLKSQDVWGYAVWAELFGPRWMEVSAETRASMCARALESGAVREHHGTIDVQMTPELAQYARELELLTG